VPFFDPGDADVFHNRWLAALLITIAELAPVSANQFIVPGTGDGLDMLRSVAALYNEKYPRTEVIFPPSTGSQGGKLAVARDQALLARVAVPLTAAEEATGLVSIEIARVPTAFFTHPAVKVASLSTEQLADIFSAKIRNWKAVGGPDLRIKVVLREETDSTLQVLRATLKEWSSLVPTDHSKIVVRTHGALDSVSQIEGAIGFGPYSKSMEGQVNFAAIDGQYPTDPEYPSFTTVRLVFKRDQLPDEIKDFIRFARSAEAARIYAAFGAVPSRDDDFLWGVGR
jgi:phosphate transport system substrate-binding protein